MNQRRDRIKLLYLCSFGCLLHSHKTCKVETRNALSTARLAWRWDLKGPSNFLSCTKRQDLYLESFVRSNTTIGCNVSHRRWENQILVEESCPILYCLDNVYCPSINSRHVHLPVNLIGASANFSLYKSPQNSDAVIKLGLCLTILAWPLDITDSDIPFVDSPTPNSCPFMAFPSTGCFVRKCFGFLHGVHCFGSLCRRLCEKSKRKTAQDSAWQALFPHQ